jgi:hypothetical protein
MRHGCAWPFAVGVIPMMRFLRISFVILTMLLRVAVVGEWIRSYWKCDELSLIHRDESLDVLAVRHGMIIFHHHDPPPAGSYYVPIKPKRFESTDIALADPPHPFGQRRGWGPFQFDRIDAAGVIAAEDTIDIIATYGQQLSVFRQVGGNYRYDPETRQEVLIPGVPSKLSALQQAEVARIEAGIAFLMARPSNQDEVYVGAPHWRIILPIWSVLILVAAPVMRAGALAIRKRRRRSRGLCGICAYDLTGNQSGVCPECGTAAPSCTFQNERNQ